MNPNLGAPGCTTMKMKKTKKVPSRAGQSKHKKVISYSSHSRFAFHLTHLLPLNPIACRTPKPPLPLPILPNHFHTVFGYFSHAFQNYFRIIHVVLLIAFLTFIRSSLCLIFIRFSLIFLD